MDIPKGMVKRQSTFDWQTAQTHPPLHNNHSNINNKNMIVRDKVLTMTTTTTTSEIVINLNNLPAKCKQSLRHIYHEMLACVYIFHEKVLKYVF